MTWYLVKGDILPGRKAELAARLKDGTLAQGAPEQERLLRGLRHGRAEGDTAYFFLEDAPDPGTRDVLEEYFALRRLVPEDEVTNADRNRFETIPTHLTEWAGVDL